MTILISKWTIGDRIKIEKNKNLVSSIKLNIKSII